MSPLRSALAAACALAASLLPVFPATASAAPAPPPTGPAYVRLAHLSPDTPNVDVHLASVSDPAQHYVGSGARP